MSSRQWSPSTLMVVRLLLIADAVLVAAVGAFCFAYVERPVGVVIGAAAWSFSGMLLGAVRFTDPYRRERR